MSEDQTFHRKISMCKLADKTRHNHKYAVTDREYEQIQAMVQGNGFDKLRDFLAFLSEENDLGGALENNRLQQLSIRLNSLATHVNMIEAGIDVAEAQTSLQEGVKQLCQDYRL